MYLLSDYDYTLPSELIAQVPLPRRDQSRLMVLERQHRKMSHQRFADLARLLHPGDLLVINNTRVVKARLVGAKETGGNVEVLLLDYPGQRTTTGGGQQLVCECLVKASKPSRPGSKIFFSHGLRATVLGGAEGVYEMALQFDGDFDALLEKIGHVPLPPYIKRNGSPALVCDDQQAYQTIYAEKIGAVAAPTAGLHFSQELVKALTEKGVEVTAITLHVGYGTFSPVRVTDIRQHQIHAETYELTDSAALAINNAKAEARRIIAVGTTCVRVLEYVANATGRVRPGSGKCDLFIYPGFRFKVITGLITNFHLPESTLLMLVSAFAGRQFVLESYREAIQRKYRFYSYGDAMFIF